MTNYMTRFPRSIRNLSSQFYSVIISLCLIGLVFLLVSEPDEIILGAVVIVGLGFIATIPGRWKVMIGATLLLVTAIRLTQHPLHTQFDRSDETTFNAKVISVDRSDWGLRILADTDLNERILISKRGDDFSSLPVNGDIFHVQGHWRPVGVPRNPGEFNYRSYLLLNQITGTVSADQFTLVQPAPKWWIPAMAAKLRQKISLIHQNALPDPYDDILGGFIFGDYGISLPAHISSLFKTLGLTHLLVVSGAQVALISGFLTLLLRKVIPNNKIVILIVTLVNIGFYFLTGGGPSILRAVIMYEISVIIALNFRNTHWANKLGLTAIILILIRPQAVADIGAQLSFLATVALLYLAPPISDRLHQSIPEWIRITLATTLATFLLTVPISVFNFNQISWISLPANFCIVLGAEWLVIIGFLATISAWIFQPLAQILFEFCLLGLVIVMKMAHFFAELEPVPSYVKQPPIILMAMYYGGFLAFGLPTFKSLRPRIAIVGSILMVGTIWHFSASIGAELPLELTFLDVGQGDATFINIGGRQFVVVDFGDSRFTPTNGGPSVYGGRVVSQALKTAGTNSIDLAVITHMHKDHYGGLAEVAQQFEIGTLLLNRDSDRHILDHYLSIKKRIFQNQLGYRRIKLMGDTELWVLHPIIGVPTDKNENNNSIVMRLKKDRFSALLTGDLEGERESWLTQTYGKKLQSLVLKVGHHGSKTSSSPAFLDAVDPQVAVISCGKFNRYRHPRPETVRRLQQRHLAIYRTDESGAIVIKTDGIGYQVIPTHAPL